MKKLSLLVILLSAAVNISAAGHIVINSGHIKPVDALAVDSKNNLLFSGDENGAVKIWDTEKNHLVKNLQVSHLPIKYISVNPVNSDLAVLETDNLTTFKLSVWDWKNGKKRFTHRLSELPLSLSFSPKGSFIVYSKPDWDSLTFLNAKKGYRMEFLEGSTGIVSSVYVSASEKTILLYTPSGTIQYWDLKTGKQKITPIRTKGNLSSVVIASNGATMTGFYDGKLYLIDLVSGKVLDTAVQKNVIAADTDTSTGENAFLSESGGKYFIDTYETKYSSLYLKKTINLNVAADNSGIVYSNKYVFFTADNGDLYQAAVSSGRTYLFSRNIFKHIEDIGVVDGLMLVSSDNKFVRIQSDLFGKAGKKSSFSYFSVNTFPVSEKTRTGIVTDEKNFYYYSKDRTPGCLRQFGTGSYSRTITEDFNSEISSIKYADGDFLSLESNGRCSVIDSRTGKTKFSYTSYGIQSVTRIYTGNIIAGRNQTGLIKSPLLNINTTTEEVVPVVDSNILTFMVDYDPVTRILYSLGFEKKGSELKTVLKAHRGRSLEITETLLTYPGEDSNASVIVDKNRSRVFTTLGFGGIHMLSWNGFTSLEESDHIPRKLFLYKNILASINSDSSISVWNTSSGSLILDIYIMENGDWAAVVKDGNVFSSPGAEKYILNVSY